MFFIFLQVYTYYNFSSVTAYLAVNYLDRFLSQYELPVRIKKIVFVIISRCGQCCPCSYKY